MEQAPKKTVLCYRSKDGKIPFLDSMRRLEAAESARVLHEIDLLEEHGSFDWSNHISSLSRFRPGTGLWELRCARKGDPIRVVYFIDRNGDIVLLDLFVKDRWSPRSRELDLAEEYVKEYRRLQKAGKDE